jgi:hypothetical protein
MKKLIPVLIVGMVVLGGLGAVAGTEENHVEIVSEKIIFSPPTISVDEQFTFVELPEATVYPRGQEKPAVPIVTRTYTFPFGTRINDVTVSFSEITEMNLVKPLKPSPEVHIWSYAHFKPAGTSEETMLYSEIDRYPVERYGFRTGAGLQGMERVTYLTVSLYPIQYVPQHNRIASAKQAIIDIDYTPPIAPVVFGDVYDFLILSPTNFQSALQPLVDHKNNQDPPVRTHLVTLEEIPTGVGVDMQEDIKYFIKDAIEEWGITYLLLVGAGVEGNELFPVRHAWIPSSPYEEYFPSDLYYADIYNSTGGFSKWDYNSNGKFAEYPVDLPTVDVLPDVYLGRMPANNAREVRIVVDKIIDYKTHNKMTKKIIQLAGDGVPSDPVYENEYANVQVLERLPGYTSIRLWGSHPNPEYATNKLTKRNIRRGFMEGVDFVDFSGHGSWASWANHPPGDEDTWLPPKTLFSPFTGFLYFDYDVFLIRNTKKLPVIVFTACSNHNYIKSASCIGWRGLAIRNGGGIASFAEAGIGHGPSGEAFVTSCIGWMEVKIFEELYNTKILGQAWSNSITSYFTTFEADLDLEDYKTMLEFSFFGDPTLVIDDGDNPISIPKTNSFSPGFL